MNELQDIEKQIETLRKREREIRNEQEKVYQEQRAKEWELYKDKLFCHIGNGYGKQKHITIMKTISCENFSQYDSCKILSLHFMYDEDKFVSFTCKKDTYRNDSLILKENGPKLGNQYANEITVEEVLAYQKQAIEEIINSFNLIIESK